MRLAGVFSLVVLLAISCGSSGASNLASPVGSTTAETCRLPIGQSRGPSGFLGYPSGVFKPDSASAVQLPFDAGGTDGITYDWALTAWLPVRSAAVAADGHHYAAIGSNVLHIIDVASKADSTFLLPKDVPADSFGVRWYVVNFDGSNVYLRDAEEQELAAFDVRQQRVSVLAGAGAWDSVQGGAAWGATVGGAQMIRFDLQTKTKQVWLEQPEGFVTGVLGFDLKGDPIAEVASAGMIHIELLSAPATTTELVSGPILGSASKPSPGNVLADSNGIWIGGGAVWLYGNGAPGAKVVQSVYPDQAVIAGPCR